MEILQRQTVVVHRQIDGEQSFRINLGLNFVPTKAIIRTIAYGKNGGADKTNYVNGIIFPWSNGEIGGMFVDDNNGNYSSNPNTIFDLKNANSLINGNVQFRVKQLTDVEGSHSVTGLIGITIEFLQEKEKESKPSVDNMKTMLDYIARKNEPFIYTDFPTQLGKGCGSCMCGRGEGSEMKETPTINQAETAEQQQLPIEGSNVEITDNRNPLEQTNPIPDVNVLENNPPIAEQEDGLEEKMKGGIDEERPGTPENLPTIRRNIPPIERRRERQRERRERERERRERERKEREDFRRRMGEYQSQIQDTQRMEQALQSTPTSGEILPRELTQYIREFNVPGERPTTPESVRRERERRRVARRLLFPPNDEGNE